ANLILVVIGVTIASVRRRGGQAVRFAIGLFVAFAYLRLPKLSEPFGYAGAVPPFVGAWLPPVLFAGLAVVLLVRARKCPRRAREAALRLSGPRIILPVDPLPHGLAVPPPVPAAARRRGASPAVRRAPPRPAQRAPRRRRPKPEPNAA